MSVWRFRQDSEHPERVYGIFPADCGFLEAQDIMFFAMEELAVFAGRGQLKQVSEQAQQN